METVRGSKKIYAKTPANATLFLLTLEQLSFIFVGFEILFALSFHATVPVSLIPEVCSA